MGAPPSFRDRSPVLGVGEDSVFMFICTVHSVYKRPNRVLDYNTTSYDIFRVFFKI